jgi:hypothetical protein
MISAAKPAWLCWVLGHACLCFPIRHAEGGEGARVVEERESKAYILTPTLSWHIFTPTLSFHAFLKASPRRNTVFRYNTALSYNTVFRYSALPGSYCEIFTVQGHYKWDFSELLPAYS